MSIFKQIIFFLSHLKKIHLKMNQEAQTVEGKCYDVRKPYGHNLGGRQEGE
jgi:hypothetical protein